MARSPEELAACSHVPLAKHSVKVCLENRHHQEQADGRLETRLCKGSGVLLVLLMMMMMTMMMVVMMMTLTMMVMMMMTMVKKWVQDDDDGDDDDGDENCYWVMMTMEMNMATG